VLCRVAVHSAVRYGIAAVAIGWFLVWIFRPIVERYSQPDLENRRRMREAEIAATPVATYEQQCAAGAASACFRASEKYEEGQGTDVDLEKAERWAAKGCELGEDYLCSRAGRLLEARAQGLADEPRRRGYQLALDDYRRACELGESMGCIEGSSLIRRELRDERFEPQRLELLARACDLFRLHCKYACEDGLDRACSKLSREELDEAMRVRARFEHRDVQPE
jgi:TPR repeat protein